MNNSKPEHISYGGWKNCLRLSNGTIELIITTDVGPRIIRCGTVGGPNFFKEHASRMGKTKENAGTEWADFGGHRLWHAPEVASRTYALDYDPVDWEWKDGELILRQKTEPESGFAKEIRIRLLSDRVELMHRLINKNPWAIEVAPWCLSVMAQGGRVIVPQEPYIAHGERFDPARPLILWSFTRMDDVRYTWGDRFIQLKQDDSIPTKQKFGAGNRQGWAAYHLGKQLFVKTFDYFENCTYPDFGSNCEFFTMPGFLEVETLGPLTKIEPEAWVDHRETWFIFDAVDLPLQEPELYTAMEPYLATFKKNSTKKV